MSMTPGILQQMVSELNAFNGSLYSGQSALQNVITQGTILYNDANFAAAFPNSIAAYKTYLLAVQSAINTFEASFPAAPVLNG